jgi:hypothetical protein
LYRKTFPAGKTAVLFDSKTYPNGNSWQGGKYTSLVPYVKNIPKGLINSFGLQGYPWPDVPADYNAAHWLNPNLVKTAANQMGIKDVWFSTGTFSKGKAWNGDVLSLSPSKRQSILNSIIRQAKILKASGYRVSVHLFAQNKFYTSEGINWSYWPKGKMSTSPYRDVYRTFMHDLGANNINLWLYDSF